MPMNYENVSDVFDEICKILSRENILKEFTTLLENAKLQEDDIKKNYPNISDVDAILTSFCYGWIFRKRLICSEGGEIGYMDSYIIERHMFQAITSIVGFNIDNHYLARKILEKKGFDLIKFRSVMTEIIVQDNMNRQVNEIISLYVHNSASGNVKNDLLQELYRREPQLKNTNLFQEHLGIILYKWIIDKENIKLSFGTS